jgi:diguanylate cyclase (GGDEF)-like protein
VRSPFGEFMLIAEPNQNRAETYRALAEDAGLIALACRDGFDSVDIVRRRGMPAVVIAELCLPRLDGFELLRQVRRYAGAAVVPAIVTCAFTNFRAAAESLRQPLGISDVLSRDAPIQAFQTALTRALGIVRGVQPAGARQEPPRRALHDRGARAASVAIGGAIRHRVPVAAVYTSVNGEETLSVDIFTSSRPTPLFSTDEWTVVRQAIDAGQPLIVPDLVRHPVLNQGTPHPDGLMRGVAATPLAAVGGGVVGALCVGDFKPLSMTASDVEFLARIGRRIAGGVDRRSDGAVTSAAPDAPTMPAERPFSATPTASLKTAALSPPRAADVPPTDMAHQSLAALVRLALTDPLTDLANRRGGEESIIREIARSRRNATPLSCVLIDIDHFKAINDVEGHAGGDEVLRQVSRILIASVRGSDLAIRWGGEEFILVLPEVDLDGARKLAERIRSSIERLRVSERRAVTISAGVAMLKVDGTIAELLAEADKRLYVAKARGRNCVV